MRKRRMWFLPETPDVIGMLAKQSQATLAGVDAFHRWSTSEGDAVDAEAIREAEHRADDCKFELRRALRSSFSTPLDSEDLYMISERLDNVINEARNTVRESELMAVAPDQPTAHMAGRIAVGARHLDAALAAVVSDPDSATTEADAATRCSREVEDIYRLAAADLMDYSDLRSSTGRRELYRGTLRVAEHIVSVSERVWYAVVKEA